MQIFIFFTLKLHGAHGATIMIKRVVCMRITGKISEENLISMIMIETSVQIGTLIIL